MGASLFPPCHLCVDLQLSQLSFELSHQKVQFQGQLAQAESRIRRLAEEAEEKVRDSHTMADQC